MPKKLGTTIMEPIMNHGVLFPHLVSHLSLRRPTIGVVTPSAIYPESKQ